MSDFSTGRMTRSFPLALYLWPSLLMSTANQPITALGGSPPPNTGAAAPPPCATHFAYRYCAQAAPGTPGPQFLPPAKSTPPLHLGHINWASPHLWLKINKTKKMAHTLQPLFRKVLLHIGFSSQKPVWLIPPVTEHMPGKHISLADVKQTLFHIRTISGMSKMLVTR